MSFLEKAQIGNIVQINLAQSKDRLNKEMVDYINISPIGTISNFKITDGKGIGVILKLSDGREHWFFENEIDLLDENGNVVKKDFYSNKNNNFLLEIFEDLKYENKNKVNDLINPINFLIWLIASFKDIF